MSEKPNSFETTSAHHILFTKVLSIELKSIYNYSAWISIEPVIKLLKFKDSSLKSKTLDARLNWSLSFRLS